MILCSSSFDAFFCTCCVYDREFRMEVDVPMRRGFDLFRRLIGITDPRSIIVRPHPWINEQNERPLSPSECTHQASTTCQHEYSNYSYEYSRNLVYTTAFCRTRMSTHISIPFWIYSLEIYWVLEIVLIVGFYALRSETSIHFILIDS